MSQSHPPIWIWSPGARQYYYYDVMNDSLVFQDGRRVARPQPDPRTLLTPTVSQGSSRAPPSLSSYESYLSPPNPSHATGQAGHQHQPHASRPVAPISPTASPSHPGYGYQDPARSAFSQNDAFAQKTASAAIATQHPQPGQSQYPQPVIVQVRFGNGGQRIVEATDPTTHVRTVIQTAPANAITDPALLQSGIVARSLVLSSDSEDSERLFESFHLRAQPWKFFTIGRVFHVLLVEPAGESNTQVTGLEVGTTIGRFGERAFSKVRRFVVVREGDNYCSALPITSYGHRGVGKLGVNKSEHSVIHTTRIPPEPLPAELPLRGEHGMRPHAIKVDSDDPIDKLDVLSRLDYGKVHTIQHNIKVKAFGNVNPKSKFALVNQFGQVWRTVPTSGQASTSRDVADIHQPTNSVQDSAATQRRPIREKHARRQQQAQEAARRRASREDDDDSSSEGDDDDEDDEDRRRDSGSQQRGDGRQQIGRRRTSKEGDDESNSSDDDDASYHRSGSASQQYGNAQQWQAGPGPLQSGTDISSHIQQESKTQTTSAAGSRSYLSMGTEPLSRSITGPQSATVRNTDQTQFQVRPMEASRLPDAQTQALKRAQAEALMATFLREGQTRDEALARIRQHISSREREEYHERPVPKELDEAEVGRPISGSISRDVQALRTMQPDVRSEQEVNTRLREQDERKQASKTYQAERLKLPDYKECPEEGIEQDGTQHRDSTNPSQTEGNVDATPEFPGVTALDNHDDLSQPDSALPTEHHVQSDPGYHTESMAEKFSTSISAGDGFEDGASRGTDCESLHMPSDVKGRLIRMFADELFAELDIQHNHRRSTAIQILDRIPDLLKDFSILKKDIARSRPERKATVLVRHARNDICSELNEILATSNLELGIDDSNPMPLEDKISRWSMEPELSPEEDVRALEGIEGLDISKARQFLLEGDEYDWLISRLRSAILMDAVVCERFLFVHKVFFEGISKHEVQSEKHAHTMRLEIDWSLRNYLLEQFDSLDDLCSTIVLANHQSSTYATTCKEYVEQVWPTFGLHILSAVQKLAESDEGFVEVQVKDTLMKLGTEGTKTIVDATGSLVSLSDIFEVMVWLGTACRASPYDDSIALCEPLVEKQSSPNLCFAIQFDLRQMPTENDIADSAPCWHAMFRNPVIAYGYPVPSRQSNETGLEASPELMVALAQTPLRVCGHLLLKGFNSMLAPTKRTNNSVQWHFIVNEDGERLSLNEGLKHSNLASPNDAFFPGARHFVGWSDSVEVTLAISKALDCQFGWSGSEHAGAGLAVSAQLTLQAGQFVLIQGHARKGRRDTPQYLRPTGYKKQMFAASKWNVLFSDTDARRHWLLDGATALILLCKASLCLPTTDGDISQMRWHSISPFSPQTSYEMLTHHDNEKLLGADSSEPMKSEEVAQALSPAIPVTTDLWNILQLMHDNSQAPKSPETIEIQLKSRAHYGYEFNELIEGESIFKPHVIYLHDSAKDWYRLTQTIGTINIFGSGLGDLIRPSLDARPHCRPCVLQTGLPWHEDYLATPMSVLQNIVRKSHGHTKRSVRLAKNLYWTDPEKSFCYCPCHDSTTLRCTAVIAKLASEAKPYPSECTTKQHSIFDQYPNGAVILGYRSEKLCKRRMDMSDVPKSPPLQHVQSADGGIALNSRTSSTAQESSSNGTETASSNLGPISSPSSNPSTNTSSTPSSRRKILLSLFQKQ